MQLPLSCKALLIVGLFCSSVPNFIQAQELEPTDTVHLNSEQTTVETAENKASFNMKAFFAALACSAAVVTVASLPAMLLHAIRHSSKYNRFARELVDAGANPFSEECRDIFKASFPRYYGLLESIDYVGNFAYIGLAVKMGMETEPTTSIKEICIRSLKNATPYALCAAAITCIGALF
jgi:hypothetical protein